MSEIWLTCGLSICAGLLIAVLVLIGFRVRLIRFRVHETRLRNHAHHQRRQLQELSSAVSARRFELEWLNCAPSTPGNLPQLLEVLRRSTDDPRSFFATGCTPAGIPVATIPTELRELFHLSDPGSALLEQARIEHSRIVPLSTQTREFTILGAPEISQLWAIPCSSAGRFQGWILVSQLPDITGDAQEDQNLLLGLCRSVKISEPMDLPIATDDVLSRQEEVRLVRDMLQLRTLSDEEFSTPVEMLEEFLKQLALLSGVERASCYQRTGPEYSTIDCLGRGSLSTDAKTDAACRKLEERLLTGRNIYEISWVQLRDLGFTPALSLRTALLVPIHDPRIPGGVLILLSRDTFPRRAIVEELAHWSAEFLPTSFDRAVARQAIAERARCDGLTRLANRQSFDEELKTRLEQGDPCDLLLIDIDHFKKINDQFGHLAGDEILRAVAQTISHQVSPDACNGAPLVARYGGEEFAVILSPHEFHDAAKVAERIRERVESSPFSADGELLTITVSIGVARSHPHHTSAAELVRRADRALYRAKHSGRNRVSLDYSSDRPSVVRLDS